MSERATRRFLYLLVFAGGFTTLGVELSASRLLDPWFGNSLIVWASLIGLVLFYLALGYLAGGRIADRSPRLLTLLRLAGLGALGVGLVPVVAAPVLRVASRGLAAYDTGVLAGSMAGILLLFALPVTLLGCISPFAIRLALRDLTDSGATVGRIYALSTIGSILGSFLPVLWLVPVVGTRRTFAILSLALLVVVLAGLIRVGSRRDISGGLAAILAVALIGWLPTGPIKPVQGLLYETESAHNYIQVVDAGFELQLRLNEGEGIHSVYRAGGGLADGIWDYFLLAPAFSAAPFHPGQVEQVCIIGLAAGTVAKLFSEAYGPLAIDGAELDPAIIEVGRAWFGMNEPNVNAVAADGRRFLAHSPQRYDIIAIDAYRPPYIPFHLTTVEFFTEARQHLNPEGVIAINVGRTHTDYSLVDAIAATLAQAFPTVYVVDEPDLGSPIGNSLVVATVQPTTEADFRANLPHFDHPLLAEVGRRLSPSVRLAGWPAGTPIFTDDRAPVEQVVHRLLLRYMLHSE